MYYSKKGLKPKTACVMVRRKSRYGTGIEQINCPFIDAMFVFCNLCARAASHPHERAQKTVFRHLKNTIYITIANTKNVIQLRGRNNTELRNKRKEQVEKIVKNKKKIQNIN